jgi:hypothetical protein
MGEKPPTNAMPLREWTRRLGALPAEGVILLDKEEV